MASLASSKVVAGAAIDVTTRPSVTTGVTVMSVLPASSTPASETTPSVSRVVIPST